MTSDAAKGWPDVAGRCPACQRRSLFLGAGGWQVIDALEADREAMPTDDGQEPGF